ncbi:MAG: F0F1 ATP synthase subunit B [Chthoniobacter sp.]|nr:F0F1 ATP synthase subunit B [Chthoniobacter sp.]
MTFTPLIAAEGGIVDSLVESAQRTGETFGFNAWLFFSQIISFVIVAILLQKFAYKPILTVLEERRKRIADGLANADKIKQQLAESEQRYQEILTKANTEAQKMIDEARASAAAVKEKETQRAIGEAEQILVKAREAAAMEHTKMLAELKREVGRLVIGTTTKVTGKVLNADDQKRLSEEAAREVAA